MNLDLKYFMLVYLYEGQCLSQEDGQDHSTNAPLYTSVLMIMASHQMFSSQFKYLTTQTRFGQTNTLTMEKSLSF